MTMNKQIGLKAAILAGAMLASAGAYAATETTTMSVSATVTNNCNITTTSMAFGAIESADPTNKDATATVTVNCSATPTSSSVAVGGGNNLTGSQRRLLNGTTNFLNYNLFSDSARTAAIAPGGNMVLGAYDGTTFDATGTIYGRIPSGQTAALGAYTDSVLLTLTYEP